MKQLSTPDIITLMLACALPCTLTAILIIDLFHGRAVEQQTEVDSNGTHIIKDGSIYASVFIIFDIAACTLCIVFIICWNKIPYPSHNMDAHSSSATITLSVPYGK